MAKRKESFFERLTKKNYEQESATKPAKERKRWKPIVIWTSLVSAIALGITIPVVVTTTNKNYREALPDDSVLMEYTTTDGKKIKITVKALKNKEIENYAKDPQKQLEQLHRLALYYLYEKEAIASRMFQHIWNSSLKKDEKEKKDIKLPTIEERKKTIKNELLDQQDNMKQRFGFSGWEKQFNEYLIKNFDGAKNIDEAIDYQLYKTISSDALRRFRLVTAGRKDLIDRTANNDIYDLDKDGDPITSKAPLYKKGDKVFTEYAKNKFYFDDENSGKDVMSFMTDSYLYKEDSYKSADIFVENYLKNDEPAVVSQFTFPGVVRTKKDGEWTVNKDAIEKLFFAHPTDSNETVVKYGFTKVKETFKPLDSYAQKLVDVAKQPNFDKALPKEALEYSTVLSKYASDDEKIKTNFGSVGLSSTISMLGSKTDLPKILAQYPDILGTDAIQEIDLFAKLEEIRKSLGLTDPNFTTDVSKNKEEGQKYNKALKDLFEKYAKDNENDFKEKITKAIAKIFETDGKHHILYKLKDNGSDNLKDTYIWLNDKGITIFNIKNMDKLTGKTGTITPQDRKEAIIKMLKNDFLIESKYSKDAHGVTFNAKNSINANLTEQNYVLSKVLEETEFITHLKKQKNIYAVDSKGKLIKDKKYDDTDIENLKSYLSSAISASKRKKVVDIAKNITQWAEDLAKTELNLDVEIANGQEVVFKNNNTKPADEVIYEKIKDLEFFK